MQEREIEECPRKKDCSEMKACRRANELYRGRQMLCGGVVWEEMENGAWMGKRNVKRETNASVCVVGWWCGVGRDGERCMDGEEEREERDECICLKYRKRKAETWVDVEKYT
ncbi:hypothetical protein Pcinc_020290 [Petrolisthes cinctipes]|uniref:Uncharacterized protein n=1 Tax=Petrolisthes cinctipes TaxID=88211 RepID=A0AAE1FKH7_PETCI|nr:hypothetical protein Pcinc_020290 [Petrolisthes cinctipes]